MAKQVDVRTFGVDVAKSWLDIYAADRGGVERIDNTEEAIETWLRGVTGPAWVAVEATNRYHERFIEPAHGQGHRVYVIDAFKLSRYRDAVGRRAKTDRCDAELLARYVQQEHEHLPCWQPRDPRQARLWRLLRRRATLVQTNVRLRQSLADIGALDDAARALIRHCQQLVRQVDRELRAQARRLGWQQDLQRSCGIPGLGPTTSLALVAAFHRHDFRNADAFVAFIGLDVRVRDSGKFRGRRKLTKKGDPEIRRLLYNAAMCGCRLAHWKPYYRSLRDRGFSGTAALVILARKMVRVCYALLEKQASFDPKIRKLPCNAT
ncbi:MAG: transposase [Gammaproteobacteria bacterium]